MMSSVVDRIDGGMLLSIHYNISGKSSLSMWADLMKLEQWARPGWLFNIERHADPVHRKIL